MVTTRLLLVLLITIGLSLNLPAFATHNQAPQEFSVLNDKSSYNHDFAIINGQKAQSYLISMQMILPHAQTFTELSTIWMIPTGIIQGTQTIHVSDDTQRNQTTLTTDTLQKPGKSLDSKTNIPQWIRNNAKWWSEGLIGDSDFTRGIEYMINEKIIIISQLPEKDTPNTQLKDEKRAMGLERDNDVPDWVKNLAGWWAGGLITDDDFVNGIQYMVQVGIIVVKSMNLTSQAFEDGGIIPAKYTCDGDDISPPLTITHVPGMAKSLAMIVDDPDAPVGTFVHWVVWNIPVDKNMISEGESLSEPQGKTDFGRSGYGGPCPPSGTHRYFFKLYALDTTLDLDSDSTKKDLETAMQGHIIEQTKLMGRYSRN